MVGPTLTDQKGQGTGGIQNLNLNYRSANEKEASGGVLGGCGPPNQFEAISKWARDLGSRTCDEILATAIVVPEEVRSDDEHLDARELSRDPAVQISV